MTSVDDLERLVGATIRAVRRVHHVHQGVANRDVGIIELELSSGAIASFDVGSDGEGLVLTREPWTDPFEHRLDEKNLAWIAEYGKLTAFDVSGEVDWQPLIGAAVTSVEPLWHSYKLVGARLTTQAGTIEIVGDYDELFVTIR
jgi:hypothetical protein